MLQALLSSERSDEPVRTVRERESRQKVYEGQSGDRMSDVQSGRLTTCDLGRKKETECL